MSHAATNWAIRQRGLKPATKIVLWHLCDRYNPDNGCFPMQETLAHDCEMSRSGLNVHLKILEERGLIRREVSRDEGTKQQRPTRYFFAFEDEKAVSENWTQTGKAVSRKRAKPCPENGQSRVQNLDSNSVSEPVSEPVSSNPLVGSPADAAVEAKADRPRELAPIPEKWVPSDDGREYALSMKLTDAEIGEMGNEFREYWADRYSTNRRDKAAKKSERGWEQCWRNHVRRSAWQFIRNRKLAGGAHPGGYGQGGSLASIAARRRAAGQV